MFHTLCRTSRVLAVIVLVTGLSLLCSPLFAGWSSDLPRTNLVTAVSGKRNNVFYVGQPVQFTFNKSGAVRYEVRDYYGEMVDQGPVQAQITLNVHKPGWYKLYLYGAVSQEPWGAVVGGTTFVIFRNTPGFPDLPAANVGPGGSYYSMDSQMRGVIGAGPFRLFVADASKPDEAIAKLEADVALDQQYYLPFDPVRKRVLMCAFPNGTSDTEGVRQIVNHFRDTIQYWEPRNEPQGTPAATFVQNEMKPFYEVVKSVDPSLKVMGPGTVSIGPGQLKWIDDFFKAGGGDYIDAFSFHAYNAVNGDLWLARHSLEELNKALARNGKADIEKWQTEQGYFAPVYGSYQPRLQGRWTMVQMMVYEQFGIPKEHNHYWYDKSHGFWDFPTWWENDDGSLNPAAPLLRVWSEELWGTTFSKAYDFGASGNNLYVGSLFSGPSKKVAAFMSAGSTDGEVTLRVTGPGDLHCVSAFGVAQDYKVVDGKVTLVVSELPVYVEIASDQTIEVVPQEWSTNLARIPGVVVKSSGSSANLDRINNGQLENWYYAQGQSAGPWVDDTGVFPAWVEIDLPKVRPVDRVVIFAAPPWQSQSTLLDYELQYDKDGQWVTIDHIQEPTRTFKVYTPPVRCSVDSFFSDRWVFQHHFAPVTTGKLRIFVHDVTWGGGATQDVVAAGGQTGPHKLNLREIEIYDTSSPMYSLSGRITDASGNGVPGVQMIVSGWENRSVQADEEGNYRVDGLVQGAAYKISPSKPGLNFSPNWYESPAWSASAKQDFAASSVVPGQGSGLTGDYYFNRFSNGAPVIFGQLVFTRVDPEIDFDWDLNPPISWAHDHFSVRWQGQVVPRYTEPYTFQVSLGGPWGNSTSWQCRLWVNKELVIDNWDNPRSQSNNHGTINLVAGKKYDIKLDYSKAQGWMEAKLRWSSPTQALEIVPQSQLFPAVSGSAVNEPPVAYGFSRALTEEPEPLLLLAADPESRPLIYRIVNPPANGTLTGAAPNLLYTPAAGFAGQDSFTFRVSDGYQYSNVATVTLNVQPRHPYIKLTTTSPPQTAIPGSRVLLTVTCTNTSSSPAVNAVVKGMVPANTVYVEDSATDGGVYDARDGAVRWVLPRLEGGQSRTVSYRVRIK